MKKLLLIFFLVLSIAGYSQSVTEVIYPKFVQGVGSGVPSQDRKVPYACRMTLTGLTPNATYRYYSRFVFNPADFTNGIGTYILVNLAGNFTRVTLASLSTPGSYGEFTTNSSGSFTYWFIVEPGSDPDFQPGTELYWRIMLNDGAGGGTVVTRITAANPITVLNWGSTQTTNGFVNGSALWGATNAAFLPKNFVMLYDNIAGTGRPVTGTFIEADGTANTTANGYVPFYQTNVNEINSRWGTIIPNNLTNGINNVSQYGLSNGSLVSNCTSATGVWNAANQAATAGLTTDTKNANWGLTANFNSVIPRNINCTPAVACNLSLATTQTNVLCFGAATGAVNLTVNGAAGAVSYAWTGPGGFTASTEDISGLVAGTYNVIVTETATPTCTATTSVTITQPASALSANAVGTNVLCFGAGTGSVNLTVSGGTIPYSYLWSNGATTEDISGLVAGTYTVTVTDANGCTTTASATITQPASALTATTSATHVLCFGQSTGAVNLTVSGGTSPYSYLWSNGATTEDISGLISGTYNVTVTDANGCTRTASATVTQPASALNASTTATNATCGASNGSIDLTVTGGTTPYTYLWSNNATTQDISGLAAGTYSVVVTDANGCTTTASATVNNTGGATASVTGTTNVLCFGAATGAINITVTGGTAPYTYLWSNGATTEDISGLTAGTYTVIVTDAGACTATTGATITQPTAITANTTVTNATCGISNGAVNLTVTGGVAPYTFLWSNGATTEDISGLSAGTYNVTVTDANGCTKTASATVISISVPVASVTGITNVLCFGAATGAINITVTGGTTPYTFLWSNAATTEDIIGLTAGTYSVTITDASGCTATASATVTQPAGSLSAVATAINATCGATNGSIDLTVTGGTLPYTFLWSNGATTEDITGLAAGAYTVIITDANGCTLTAGATVNNTGGPSVAITNTVNVLCFGLGTGSINITVTGGTAPYTFLWSNGATTEDISGLTAGTYSVTITDGSGCTATNSATITQPASEVTATTTATNSTCGNANAAINLTVSGGTAPYTYLWNNGATTEDISGLSAGTYTVTITDANGCTKTASATVSSTPVPVVTVTGTTNVLCFGQSTGAVNITVNGGTAPYTYLWSNGATTEDISGLAAGTYSVSITDASACTATNSVTITQPASALSTSTSVINATCGNPNGSINLTVTGGTPAYTYLWSNGATTEDVSGLTAGTYTVTVTDANGCTTTASRTITNISGPGVAVTGTTNVLCFGQSTGSINITVTGGTTPYTFLWSNGATAEDINNLPAGTYTVIVTDANGCTATIGSTITQPVQLTAAETHTAIACFGGNSTITISGTGGTLPYTGTGTFVRPAGTYSFTVTDANGCTAAVAVTIAQPAQLTATETHTAIACFGGNSTITIIAAGGTAPYSGAGTFIRTAGTYNFTITDANGCTSIIPVTITQPTIVTAASSVGVIACNGGTTSVTVTANGGTAPYTGTGTFTRSAGPYSYTVTDANGCTAVTSGTITQPAVLLANASAANISCNGGSASITITATGGTAPYIGTGTFTRGPGTWSFTVTDARGCTAVTAVTITQPTVLTAKATAPPITACAGNTVVTVTASGGTAPYPYAGVGSYIRGPGTWDFTVTDAAGCTATTKITIDAPDCLKVYPIPARSNLFVSHSRATKGTTIKVFDNIGRLLLVKQVPENAILTTFDVSTFSGGSYMLVFYMDGEKKLIQFTIH